MRKKGRELETPGAESPGGGNEAWSTTPAESEWGLGNSGKGSQGNRVLQFYRTRNADNKSVRRNLVSNEKSADWEWIRRWEG